MCQLEERAVALGQRRDAECTGDPNTCPYAEPDPGSPEAPACMAHDGDRCEWHRKDGE